MPRPTKEILGLTRMTPKGLRELCKKNQLYQTPGLNDVLYLHYQGFQQIECLEEYTGLKCLWLENNAISDIEGLDNQKILKCLFLHNNLISRINNLQNCRELDTINLSYNHITKIENCGVEVLPVLTSLNLSHNYIKSFDQVENLVECKSLSVLDLANNRIEDILIVTVLAQMPELRVLVLQGNPVVNKIPQYRKTLILECKQLTYLDQRPVFPKDRACAEAWKRGGYDEERREHDRWIKAEQKKIRDSVNATLRLRNRGGGEPQVQLILSSDDEDDGATERTSGPTLEEEKKLKTQEAEFAIMSEFLKLGDLAKDFNDPTIPTLCFVCHRLNCKAEHPKKRVKKRKCTETPEDIMDSTNLFNEEKILLEDEDGGANLSIECSKDTKEIIENLSSLSGNENVINDLQDECKDSNTDIQNDNILLNDENDLRTEDLLILLNENSTINSQECIASNTDIQNDSILLNKDENDLSTEDLLILLNESSTVNSQTEEKESNNKVDDIKYIDIKYIDDKKSSSRQNSIENKSEEPSAKSNKKRVRIAIEQISSEVDRAIIHEPEDGINEPKRKRVDISANNEVVTNLFVGNNETKSDNQLIVTSNKLVQVDIESRSQEEVDGCNESQEAERDLELNGLSLSEYLKNEEQSNTNQVLKEHHHACTQTSFIKESENRIAIQSLVKIITIKNSTNDSNELVDIDTKSIPEPEKTVAIEDGSTTENLPTRNNDDDKTLIENESVVIDARNTNTEDLKLKETPKERVLHLIKPVNIFNFNADDCNNDTTPTESTGPPIDVHELLDFHKYNMPDQEDTEDTKAVLKRMCSVNYTKLYERDKTIEEEVEQPNLIKMEQNVPSFKDAVFFVSKPQNGADRTRTVESLLSNPLTKKMSDELKAISPEDLEEQVENAKELKYERISKMINCVYAKKDRYDDDLELVDNKLVVVRRDKPLIEPIINNENLVKNTENIKVEEKLIVERKIIELEDIIEEVETENGFDDNNAKVSSNITKNSVDTHMEESLTILDSNKQLPKSKIEEDTRNSISCESNFYDSLENINDVYATPPLISSSYEELATCLDDTQTTSFGNQILLTSTKSVSLYDNKADCSEADKTNEMEEYYAYDIEDVTRLCSEQAKQPEDDEDADQYFLGPKYDDILFSIDQSFKKDLVVLLDDCCKEYALCNENATEVGENNESSDDEDDINNKSYDKYWKHYNGDIEEYRKTLKLENHPLIVELNQRLKQNRTITDEEFNSVLPKLVLAHKEYLLNHEDVEAQELAKKILKDNDLPTE